MSTLITYFSAEAGTTAKVAKDLAAKLGANIFEIKPEKPYTNADLNWKNPLARCNREKLGKKDVPVAGKSIICQTTIQYISGSLFGTELHLM